MKSRCASRSRVTLRWRPPGLRWNARIRPADCWCSAGLLSRRVAALSVRYVLISRLKSAHLAKSLALNAGIISSSAHLVIAIDAQYRIMIFNRAAEKALGYSAQEVVGKRAIPIFMDPAELMERARTLSIEIGETRRPRPGDPDAHSAARRPRDTRVDFHTQGRHAVPDQRDHHAAARRTRRHRRIPRRHRGRDQPLRGGPYQERIHRGGQPRAAHAAHVDSRLAGPHPRRPVGQPAAESRDLLEIAQNNSDRLALLINDILDIEKFSAGQMRFDMATMPLGEVVRQAVVSNEGYARKHQREHRAGAGRSGHPSPRRSRPLRAGPEQPAVERREVLAGLGARTRARGTSRRLARVKRARQRARHPAGLPRPDL
jgi:PAS domain-containing protein